MRECKVSPRGAHYSATIRDFDPIGGHRREVRSCCYCNEVTPLGPSDEFDPRVASEIRAAEIAAHRLGWLCLDTIDKQEMIGFAHSERGAVDCEKWSAGYLAKCIVEHDWTPESARDRLEQRRNAHAITTHGSET